MSARLCEPVVAHCWIEAPLFDFAANFDSCKTDRRNARFFIDAIVVNLWQKLLLTKETIKKKSDILG